MATRIRTLLLLFLLLLGTGTVQGQQSLAVIVHPDHAQEDVELSELRRILRLDRQYWRTGDPIRLMLPGPSAAERDRVLEQAFQMSEQAFRQHWIAVAYRVQALALPRPYSDCSVAVRVVSTLETAMAVVDADCVGDADVKVLRIDGKLPGDKGYRL